MNAQRGFTLVETLIAFAILAVVLVALYEAMGTGLRAFEAAARVEEAVLIAESQLDRIVALRRVPGEREGAVDGTPYRWRVEIVPSRQGAAREAANAPLQAVTIRLAVSWPGSARARSIAIERMLFVPRPPG